MSTELGILGAAWTGGLLVLAGFWRLAFWVSDRLERRATRRAER